MNYLQFMVPRLEGDRIERDFKHYLNLARKGVAGFIVFGGEFETLREGIRKLQEASVAPAPLIIASDLERGLGQQVKGGTLFPPAMALAGLKPKLLRKIFTVMAEEAAYAGVNTVFAPVLDINTNPDNPIIATRAFGEEPRTVSKAGTLMIKTLQGKGIEACGKHFPGHGDTAIDSHIGLPIVYKTIKELRRCELVPFEHAIRAGVSMIMLGHLSVPALDKSGIPVSLSKKAVEFLRIDMGFKGIIVTDAMNMAGIGAYSEADAARMALNAGVDIILHPSNALRLARHLDKEGVVLKSGRLLRFRRGLRPAASEKPSFDKSFAFEVTKKTIKTEGQRGPIKNPYLVILTDDDDGEAGKTLIDGFKRRFPSGKYKIQSPGTRPLTVKNGESVVAVFSSIKAWKGGVTPWLRRSIYALGRNARVLISFGSPYLIRDIAGPKLKVYAYSDSVDAQRAVAEMLLDRG